MKKVYKYNNYLYIALQIFIGIDVIYRCKSNINNLLIFTGLFLVIVINDYLRGKYFYKSIKGYYSSVLISMIISMILEVNIDGYVDIYFFMILYELILYTEGKISRLLISLEMISFLTLIVFRTISGEQIGTIEFWQKEILDIVMISMGLFFYSLSLFGYKILKKEKREVDRLNKELELSYDKLKEQSEKIEELTITKERNRVAEEIHDNLGHSLIALNMSLDVADKIIDKDINKAKDLINKAQILTKESMENLRKAVYALKEERPTTLRNSIEKIIDNIESTGKVKITLDIDEKSEELLPEYKDIIHNSVKESLTNSIKHGKADKVNICIKLDKDEIRINIKDNGFGCSNLVKGNGLLGIENRFRDYGGEVIYESKENEGFEIELILGLEETKIFLNNW
jgi:signal transduction histidine kinase